MRNAGGLPLLVRYRNHCLGGEGRGEMCLLDHTCLEESFHQAEMGQGGGESRSWLKCHRCLLFLSHRFPLLNISSFAVCPQENFQRCQMVVFKVVFTSFACFTGEGTADCPCHHLGSGLRSNPFYTPDQVILFGTFQLMSFLCLETFKIPVQELSKISKLQLSVNIHFPFFLRHRTPVLFQAAVCPVQRLLQRGVVVCMSSG